MIKVFVLAVIFIVVWGAFFEMKRNDIWD